MNASASDERLPKFVAVDHRHHRSKAGAMISTSSKFAGLENDVEERTPVKNKNNNNKKNSSGSETTNCNNNQKGSNMGAKNKKKNPSPEGQQQPQKQQQNQDSKAGKKNGGVKGQETKANGTSGKVPKKVTFSPSTVEKTCPLASECDSQYRDSKVQVFFLWFISAIYFFAFFSYYWQIRGLYGDKGVLPLRYYVAQYFKNNRTVSYDEMYLQSPSLVWLLSKYGFSLTTCLELITLSGLTVSFLQLLSKSFRSFPNYIFLYLTYYSVTKVGQTFMHFQWDSLLLEAGIVATLVALRPSQLGALAPSTSLTIWPMKWLLFRLMFSSGVVKLTSRCPLWWSLRALDVHFESQCLPTGLAWYANQIPPNWLSLGVAATYFIEIIVPFFFFVPIRGFRIFSFWSQIFLQVLIIATGNYNFFNLLTCLLCLGLLYEEPKSKSSSVKSSVSGYKTMLVGAIVAGLCAFFFDNYFSLSFDKIHSLNSFIVGPTSKINFTLDQFNLFLVQAITLSIWIGCISFAFAALTSIIRSFQQDGFVNKISHLFGNGIAIVIIGMLLSSSIVPLADLDTSGQYVKAIPNSLKRLNAWSSDAMVVNSYGLFRSMTGENGRPEIIIEGANDPQNDKWLPYHFLYKPGDLDQAPKFIVPYQPRLDWQMWFAALGSYQSNPWLLNLCFRILSHEPDVLALMDNTRLPFPLKSPPKYIRISRYSYGFTNINDDSTAWWALKNNRQAYMPVVNRDTVINALKLDEMKLKIPGWVEKLPVLEQQRFPFVKVMLDSLYQNVILQNVLLPHHIMWAFFSVAFYLQMLRCNRVAAQRRQLQTGL